MWKSASSTTIVEFLVMKSQNELEYCLGETEYNKPVQPVVLE